jgi:hypothetical protein
MHILSSLLYSTPHLLVVSNILRGSADCYKLATDDPLTVDTDLWGRLIPVWLTCVMQLAELLCQLRTDRHGPSRWADRTDHIPPTLLMNTMEMKNERIVQTLLP